MPTTDDASDCTTRDITMVSDSVNEGPSRPLGSMGRARVSLEIAVLAIILATGAAMLYSFVRGGWPASQGAARAAPSSGLTKTMLPMLPISLDGAQLQGSHAARAVIIEYSDFQCPYCGRFAKLTLPDLRRSYIDTGKVLFAFRHFPLEEIHKFALGAAEAAECAGRQGAFWKMHDLNFADQETLQEDVLAARAQSLGIDVGAFDRCLHGPALEIIRTDLRTGESLDVTGTPTFFLGRPQPDGRVSVVARLVGAVSSTEFHTALDEILGASPLGSTATKRPGLK
jgi:protein-disulfide isomerase